MHKHFKILFVSPSVSRLFTGVYEVEKNLASEFVRKNNTVEIHGLIDEFSQQDLITWSPNKPILYKPFLVKKIGFNPVFLRNLNKSNADVGHIHSLWSYTTYALYKWSIINKKPYVLSANAYLFQTALNQSKFFKKLALKLGINKVIKNATCIHVNTRNEYSSVRALGYKNPISIISNGVQMPDLTINYSKPCWHNDPNAKNKKILLYLSRIHSQKGVDLLIESWKNLSHKNYLKDWHLVIVGFNNDLTTYEKKIISKIEQYNISKNITLLPGQFNESMKSCYFSSNAFILPSYNEGSSIAALNALAYSKPALITEGCNITDSFKNNAAIKIETNIESISRGILTLINMNDLEREILGKNARTFVEKFYSWDTISNKILELYNWLSDNKISPIPDTVILD